MVTAADPGTSVDDRPVILSWRRVATSLAAGLVVGVAVALTGFPELAVLAGWSAAAGGLLVQVWRVSWPCDHERTRWLAEEEGRTRVTDTAVLAAAVISLGAVAQALVRSGSGNAAGVVSVVLGVLVVMLSWALVNTVFALKYARVYYEGEDGGLDFDQERPPTYSDFAYVAFTMGMSFFVPGVDLVASSVRKVALGHLLLAYVFGTVVIAVSVNLVTNLGQGG